MRRRIRPAVGVAIAALGAAVSLSLSPSAADAQIVPSSTTTTTEESTTTTSALLPSTTTTTLGTTTTAAPASTTSTASTSTTRPRSTSTTKPGSTTTTFVPPSGVSSTTAPAAPTVPLDASTSWLPFFVILSLGGFAVAVGILTFQWIQSRPRRT